LKLFFDANVILDVLTRREPWYEHSAASLSLLDDESFEGYVAAHSVTTLYNLLRRYHDHDRAVDAILNLLRILNVAGVDHDVLVRAFGYGTDVEDAVQAVCALDVGADYLITRDRSGFGAVSMPAVTPTELLAVLAADDTPGP
jgi:predicted nucleic acid-binding protein